MTSLKERYIPNNEQNESPIPGVNIPIKRESIIQQELQLDKKAGTLIDRIKELKLHSQEREILIDLVSRMQLRTDVHALLSPTDHEANGALIIHGETTAKGALSALKVLSIPKMNPRTWTVDVKIPLLGTYEIWPWILLDHLQWIDRIEMQFILNSMENLHKEYIQLAELDLKFWNSQEISRGNLNNLRRGIQKNQK